MSDLAGVRKMIQVEETQYRSAVSEAFAQKLGSSVNFINIAQKYDKGWFVNGTYALLTLPYSAIDGIYLVPDNATITNAMLYVRTAGSSGTTELDIKYATTPGGAWTSIFSTTPKITSAAGNYAWCYTGSAFSNTTAPVLSTTTLNAGSALRCDIIQAQGGTPVGCGLILYMQPR